MHKYYTYTMSAYHFKPLCREVRMSITQLRVSLAITIAWVTLRVGCRDAVLAPVQVDGLTSARALLGRGRQLGDSESLPAGNHHGFTVYKIMVNSLDILKLNRCFSTFGLEEKREDESR